MTNEEIRKRLLIIKDFHAYQSDDPVYYTCQWYADEEHTIELEHSFIHENDVDNINDYQQVEDFAIHEASYLLPILIEKYYTSLKKEKVIWWVNMLFKMRELEETMINNEDRAAEVKAAREYVLQCIEKAGEENGNDI